MITGSVNLALLASWDGSRALPSPDSALELKSTNIPAARCRFIIVWIIPWLVLLDTALERVRRLGLLYRRLRVRRRPEREVDERHDSTERYQVEQHDHLDDPHHPGGVAVGGGVLGRQWADVLLQFLAPLFQALVRFLSHSD